MSAHLLLKGVDRDTDGVETVLRVIGTREPPARMVIQVAITGSGDVQIQGRVARDAPWQSIGPVHSASTIMHIDAVQFLRATASKLVAKSSVSVWADWAW
jgi:hypothetical protein